MNQNLGTYSFFGTPKKRVIPKWLLITFIIVAVLGAGFFTWFYLFGPGKTKPATIAAPATNPIADWQTYKNDAYGFSLKYPKDWFTDTTSDSSVVILSNKEKASQYDKSNSPKDLLSLGVKEYSSENQVTDQKYLISATTTNNITVYSLRDPSGASSSTKVYQKVGKFTNGSKTLELWMNSDVSAENMASEISYFDKIVPTIELTTPIVSTPKTSTPSPITYTNGEFGFTFTMPATWEKYKIKTANYEGEVATLYIELPTTESSSASPTNDEGYYSPFAIGVYTPEQWAAVQATGGPSGTVITQTAQYVFVWSQSNGVPPSDFDKSGDIKAIIDSFKTT